MYIERLDLENIRTFTGGKPLVFVHPDGDYRPPRSEKAEKDPRLPKPKLPNVNLLLGDNGSGKTTVLQAIALATLGPAVEDARLPLRPLVRFLPESATRKFNLAKTIICARLLLHEQDGREGPLDSRLDIGRRGELESIRYRWKEKGEERKEEEKRWSPVFESKNEAFFCVGYGATRRIDAGESLERGSMPKSRFIRGERTQSIFQDSFGLFPLKWWLPELKATNPGRYTQVVEMTNQFLAPADFRFTGDLLNREYLFERGKTLIPLLSMSDGYRAFVGWVSDLLYHICFGCPSGKKLVESSGIVMVDEIDLHLHPKWQMKVIATVAKTLPRMQFVFTSHSPLVAGSLEWMNIITLKVGAKTNRTIAKRLKQSIHGMDADQILLTDFFGLKTTMAPAKRRQLDEITDRIRAGDKNAPLQLIREMSSGTEVEE